MNHSICFYALSSAALTTGISDRFPIRPLNGPGSDGKHDHAGDTQTGFRKEHPRSTTTAPFFRNVSEQEAKPQIGKLESEAKMLYFVAPEPGPIASSTTAVKAAYA